MIYGDYEIKDVRNHIDEVCLVAKVEVVHYGSFIEVGELSHVISFVKLGWVDFVDVVGVNISFLGKLRLAAVEAELVAPVQIESFQV